MRSIQLIISVICIGVSHGAFLIDQGLTPY